MWLLVAVALAVLGGFGCDYTQPLMNTSGSSESLATVVLDAIARSDRNRLESLALSEQEFKDYVWPELPAARPERNLPFSYVWGDLRQKSVAALGATLASHGGRRYALVGIHFEGETTRYSSCTVRRRTVLTVRKPDGAQEDVRMFGSSIECEGAWKVFSFVTD